MINFCWFKHDRQIYGCRRIARPNARELDSREDAIVMTASECVGVLGLPVVKVLQVIQLDLAADEADLKPNIDGPWLPRRLHQALTFQHSHDALASATTRVTLSIWTQQADTLADDDWSISLNQDHQICRLGYEGMAPTTDPDQEEVNLCPHPLNGVEPNIRSTDLISASKQPSGTRSARSLTTKVWPITQMRHPNSSVL